MVINDRRYKISDLDDGKRAVGADEGDAVRSSSWWKVDLQVATPGGGFKLPGAQVDPSTPDGKRAAAATFVQHVIEAGLDVIALADHNSGEWVDEVKAAASGTTLKVFSGVEITSGSGQDGIHLVLVGDEDVDSRAIDRLLYSVCGFDAVNHKTHDSSGNPMPTPKSLFDILSDLPDSYLAIGPHAFGQNGIARKDSIDKQVRWKTLHHDKLVALDVGKAETDPTNETGFRARFRRRELDSYKFLKSIAFVSTSDAYGVEQLGKNFSWIRMQSPTFEALRQAMLDYEARIICSWEPRFDVGDPNDVHHAWVESVSLDEIANSTGRIEIEFDPHLNVLIGGRGSGKSTVVAALRSIYGSPAGLPRAISAEIAQFDTEIFGNSILGSFHHLAVSQEKQSTKWTAAQGSLTTREGLDPATNTNFKVRVISQKELYERARSGGEDPWASSTSLLGLIDREGIDEVPNATGQTLPEQLTSRRNEWITAARAVAEAEQRVAPLDDLRARIGESERTLETLDSEASRARRMRNEAIANAEGTLRAQFQIVEDLTSNLSDLRVDLTALPVGNHDAALSGEDLTSWSAVASTAQDLAAQANNAIDDAISAVREALDRKYAEQTVVSWRSTAQFAAQDAVAYRDELISQGIDESTYDEIRRQLESDRQQLTSLEEVRNRLEGMRQIRSTTWDELRQVHVDRGDARMERLQEVAQRSGVLRFSMKAHANLSSWVAGVRGLLNLRSDGFIDEVLRTAQVVFASPAETTSNVDRWRDGLIEGDLSWLTTEYGLRSQWSNRLESQDLDIRLRVAAEFPDDSAEMFFLKDKGDPSDGSSWQPVVEGSPGQRTTAMLALVLHLGEEPLVLDQPEDDLDTEWLSQLVVKELRASRWTRQLIVVTHNANIPVNGDADRVVVLENSSGKIAIRQCDMASCAGPHTHPIESVCVRRDVQNIMEGGVDSFVRRERRYNNELSTYRAAVEASPL